MGYIRRTGQRLLKENYVRKRMYPIDLKGKTGIVFGVANHRSIAWSIAKVLHQAGAKLAIAVVLGDLVFTRYFSIDFHTRLRDAASMIGICFRTVLLIHPFRFRAAFPVFIVISRLEILAVPLV